MMPSSGKPARPKISTRASATFSAVPAASMPSTVHVCPPPEKKPLTAAITIIGNAAKQRQRR